jgi:hypothetical protein
LSDPAWFQFGSYTVFESQAQEILEGKTSAFWISDPTRTDRAIYPPGFPVWLAVIYKISGDSSAATVQKVQWILDSLSVLLVLGIGVTAFGWRVGLAAGILGALSPLLALYGASPLADSPTSWIVLGAAWMLLVAVKRRSLGWAFTAGAMVGASCWFRANALLLPLCWALALMFLLRIDWRQRALLAALVVLGATLAVAPLIVRNAVAFGVLAPTGLGLGTNLWEGIGETDRASEVGAVYGDKALIEQERVALGVPPDAQFNLYYPDGVRRDHERARKALSMIARHPVWYAQVMVHRMACVLKYAGKPGRFCGSAGINVTSSKCLPGKFQNTAVAASVNLLGMIQSVLRYLLLPLILAGTWLAFRSDWRIAGLISTTVIYYLVIGSAMHTEIRYGLPMHGLLLIFAGLTISKLLTCFQRTGSVARQDQGLTASHPLESHSTPRPGIRSDS